MPYTSNMPSNPQNTSPEIDTNDLMLQKLGDIEGILTMRLSQAQSLGESGKEDIELVQQLLAKVATGISEIKNLKLSLDGVEKVTIQGKPGEPGKDADPIEIAAILKESEDFIRLVKGEKGDSIKGEQGEQGPAGTDGRTPEKGVDYFTTQEIDEIKDDVKEDVSTEVKKEIENALENKTKNYVKPEQVVQMINEAIQKRKVEAKDVQGLAQIFKEEIDKVYENIQTYNQRVSGGGTLKLAALGDVDMTGITQYSILRYDPTGGGRFYFESDRNYETLAQNLKAYPFTRSFLSLIHI